jgi:4-oxalocrotonate tautomerase family enzyme
MPVVDVYGPTGLSKDQKRALIKRVTDAVHEAYGPKGTTIVFVNEHDSNSVGIDGELDADRRARQAT